MNNKTETMTDNKLNVWHLTNWLFGVIVFEIGVVNTFWGNDPGFGIFLMHLSFVYFPPVQALIKEKTSYSIPTLLKFFLGVFILWAALGVGELFDKINLMMKDF